MEFILPLDSDFVVVTECHIFVKRTAQLLKQVFRSFRHVFVSVAVLEMMKVRSYK